MGLTRTGSSSRIRIESAGIMRRAKGVSMERTVGARDAPAHAAIRRAATVIRLGPPLPLRRRSGHRPAAFACASSNLLRGSKHHFLAPPVKPLKLTPPPSLPGLRPLLHLEPPQRRFHFLPPLQRLLDALPDRVHNLARLPEREAPLLQLQRQVLTPCRLGRLTPRHL